jgi:hypothetical protein
VRLDEGDREPAIGQASGGDLAGGTGSQNHHVEAPLEHARSLAAGEVHRQQLERPPGR